MTDAGVIRIFKVDRREPKQEGTAGHFVDKYTSQPLGAPRSIKVDCEGKRVSILADHVHGALAIREPDTRLHVYDADRDVVDDYDFGVHGRYPISHFWDPQEPKLLACETARLRGAVSELRNAAGALDVPAPAPAAGKDADAKDADAKADAKGGGDAKAAGAKGGDAEPAGAKADAKGGDAGAMRERVQKLRGEADAPEPEKEV